MREVQSESSLIKKESRRVLELWGEFLLSTVHVLNRTISSRVNKTPFELFYNKKPTQVAHRLCFRSVTDLFLRVCKLFGVAHFYRLSYRSVTDP
jgi:hypothetical protein